MALRPLACIVIDCRAAVHSPSMQCVLLACVCSALSLVLAFACPVICCSVLAAAVKACELGVGLFRRRWILDCPIVGAFVQRVIGPERVSGV